MMNEWNAPQRTHFKFQAREADSVFVMISGVNNFGGMNVSAYPLKKRKAGIWSVTLNLIPGSYEYLYIVDGEWRDGPSCEINKRYRKGFPLLETGDRGLVDARL